MKAIVATKHGGPETLALCERPDHAPGPGQARVRVAAAGVNFIDVYHRTGLYPMPEPVALGQEGAGVVEAVGDGVTEMRAGDRVAWSSVPGSYATHVVAQVEQLVPVPDGVDLRVAAAAMLQGMTAQYLSRATFPLRAGHTCLVHAAAGGVGLLLCQMGRRAGARVLGTVSTDEKARLAREAGAAETIRYDRVDFAAEARALTGGRGVDVVYDSVGKTTFDGSLSSLALRGTMVLFGQSSGKVPPVDLTIFSQKGSLFFTRPSLAHYTHARGELLERAGDVLGQVARGELAIRIGATFPLEDAAEAHRALEGRRTTGKVLLSV